jgi:hypothetical protein
VGSAAGRCRLADRKRRARGRERAGADADAHANPGVRDTRSDVVPYSDARVHANADRDA